MTRCGAVSATIKSLKDSTTLPGHLPSPGEGIAPAVKAVSGQAGDTLANAIRQNVVENVSQAQFGDTDTERGGRAEKLKVVGGIYRLRDGRVEMV